MSIFSPLVVFEARNLTFTSNRAESSGGAVLVQVSNTPHQWHDCTFQRFAREALHGAQRSSSNLCNANGGGAMTFSNNDIQVRLRLPSVASVPLSLS